MKMRPGGREIESVVTKAPGTLEFLPNLPVQHHRILDGNDFVIAYGPTRIASTPSSATNVKTQTDPTADELKRKQPRRQRHHQPRHWRRASTPRPASMATMQQSGDFAYEEGDRKARAAKATMDADQNVIVLDTGARMWDPTGSTSADRIRLDQRTGDFVAEGNVNSSRLPDKDQKKNSEMLSGDDPLQATARKMDSRNRNRTHPLRRRRQHVAGRQPHSGRRTWTSIATSEKKHPGGRRPRGHQPVGRAQGRRQEEDRDARCSPRCTRRTWSTPRRAA